MNETIWAENRGRSDMHANEVFCDKTDKQSEWKLYPICASAWNTDEAVVHFKFLLETFFYSCLPQVKYVVRSYEHELHQCDWLH